MAKAIMHATAHVGLDEDWLLPEDIVGSSLLEDQISEFSDLLVENEEPADGWDVSTRMPFWHSEVAELLHIEEQDESMNPLPSPLEEAWLDTNNYLEPCNLIGSDEASVIQDAATCVMTSQTSAVRECGEDDESASNVADLLVYESDWSTVVSDAEQSKQAVDGIELVATIDSSQLEILLAEYCRNRDEDNDNEGTSEASDIAELVTASRDDSSEVSPSDNSDGEDSDWSYTGGRERRRPAKRRRGNRTEPYQRPNPRSKNQRKKEQNKNAATRYRERKRAEERDNEVECAKLEKRNRELREQVEAMDHEVKVLRGLIVDIFRRDP